MEELGVNLVSVNSTLELRAGKLEWRAIVVVADRFCFPNWRQDNSSF